LSDSAAYFNSFTDNFLRFQNQYSQEKGNVTDFLNKCFTDCRQSIVEKGNIGTSASLSNYVFPLLFVRLPSRIHAQEYYVLQISDFDNLSQKGSARDFEQLQQVMGHAATSVLRKSYIDLLEGNLGKRMLFYNAFQTGSKIVSIYCYTPERLQMPTINSNVKLKQKKYNKDSYQYDAVNIGFEHNTQFTVKELYEDMSAQKVDNERQSVFHREIEPLPEAIAQQKENNYLYTIDGGNVTLTPQVKDKDFDNIEIQYTFFVQQQLLNTPDCQLGYVCFTSRDLPLSDIDFRDSFFTIFWYWFWKLLPFLLALAVVLFLIAVWRGKYIEVSDKDFLLPELTDKFREMKDCVIKELNYCAWDEKTKTVSLTVKINPQYRKWFKIKWKYKLEVKVDVDNLNQSGLTASIHHNDGSGEQEIDNEFVLRDNEYSISITQPYGIKLDFDHERYIFNITTDVFITKSFLWLKTRKEAIRKNINPYHFEIGRNLGGIWVGFDPGTTGSTIAFGNDSRKIYFSKHDDNGDLSIINNSVVTFEEDKLKIEDYNEWEPGNDYLYGVNAYTAPEKLKKFRSMKKLLGYINELPIIVEGKRLFDLKGTQLFTLLVRGLYKDLQDFVNYTEQKKGYLQPDEKRELCSGGEFSPQRAVVTVPNSFTSRRTQDMVNSIAALGKFREIIPVYEAESVLFHCIKRSIIKNSSKVLVFDMGGATINTSFFDLYIETGKDSTQYTINTLGRIGYGIGGDTIDFCIINAILSIKTLQEALDIDSNEESIKQYRDNNASKLLELAFKIKEDIVTNFTKTNEQHFITLNNLIAWVKDFLKPNNDINIPEGDTDFDRIFAHNHSELFEKYIKNTVYDNIQDAIKELLIFKEVSDCKNQQIKLVFSGRSTAFPFVEDNVTNILRHNGFNIDTRRLQQGSDSLDYLKTVVAEGACWYGLQRSNVTLHNNKCFYSFAVKKSTDSTDASVAFETFIKRGQMFKKNLDGTMVIREERKVDSTFGNDSNKADIYQVTGDSPKDYYNKKDMKHKIALIASLDAVTKIEEIELTLTPNDILECVAKYDKNPKNNRRSSGSMLSVDIAKENDEHYIFATKQDNSND
jgi:molecular chaperone DnaK (HSP70)